MDRVGGFGVGRGRSGTDPALQTHRRQAAKSEPA
jgi:hypothetical protein